MENIKEILETYGSPLYVYSEEILEKRCENIKNFETNLKSALPDSVMISMHYSTKANSNPHILNAVKECGLKVDCMSPLEMYLVTKCGFKNDDILYVCNNISAEEMKNVKKQGLLICLDSISQVKTWGENFPETDIMVRINPGIIGVGHSDKVITSGKTTKFGISENNLSELFEVSKKYNLHIIGTHQHLGSLFLNDKIDNYIAGVEAGLSIVKKYFKDATIVDLGGGFGVPYTFDEQDLNLDYVAEKLKPVLRKFISEFPTIREFKFEPGRYIPCDAGSLFGTVTAVKHENETWWIGTDIGMNQLVRPSMYDSYHEILLPESKGELITANFCGNVCESGDILGKGRTVKMPKVGDPVIVLNSGAYGYSMSSNYTGRERPAEIMIKRNSSIELIRKRETLEYLTHNISF